MDIQSLLKLANCHHKQGTKWEKPFHINIIDELRIDENANSRILVKILQYKENDTFPILNSFIDLLSGKCSQINKITIDTPQISYENSRIDALILENGKYAIIIENKIYWATDQNSQIDRYVNIVSQYGFKDNENGEIPNIFVVYLTFDGTKIVSNDSFDKARKKLGWVNDENPGRFIALNYKDDILPWLDTDILPYCRLNDDCLISALKQYIDYLKGLFKQRKSDMIMNDKENGFLKEQLGLPDTNSEALECINQKINEVDDLASALKKLKESYEEKIYIDSWGDHLESLKQIIEQIAKEKKLTPNYANIDDTSMKRYFCFSKKGWKLQIHFEFYTNGSAFVYIGLPFETFVDKKYVDRYYCFDGRAKWACPYGYKWIYGGSNKFDLFKDLDSDDKTFYRIISENLDQALNFIHEKGEEIVK